MISPPKCDNPKPAIVGDPEFVKKLEEKLARFKKNQEKFSSSDVLKQLSDRKSAEFERIFGQKRGESVAEASS